MYRETLESIAGVGLFPVLSLLLFVAVFSAVAFVAVRLDKRRLDQFAALPFDDATPADAQTSRGVNQ